MSKENHRIDQIERDYHTSIGSYGDQKYAALYCGYKKIPQPINGEWQHGWIVPERNIHPELVIGSDGRSYENREHCTYYVARQDQVDYLHSLGYKHVHAIGLPILYVQAPRVKKIPGSLLVMPAHSLPETKEAWDADEYVHYINSIAHKFSLVCLCVHKSCMEKGNWVNAFNKIAISIVEGADILDQNSYLRMAELFSRFEYVTSNTFGSQIAYASLFGCKVSVAGPPPQWRKKDYEDCVLCQNAPELLDIMDDMRRKNIYAKSYPQFCCDPWDAQLNKQWAAWQLGAQCKKSPKELKILFDWKSTNWVMVCLRKAKTAIRIGCKLARRSLLLILYMILKAH